MAAFDTNRTMTLGTFAGIRVPSIVAKFNAWNETRVTRNALGKLTDRELDDIGLCRGDIEDL